MTEAETVQDVDLEALWAKSIPCNVKDCTNEVQWMLTMKCCGRTAFFCKMHHDRADRVWASILAQGKGLACQPPKGCGKRWTDLNIDIRWDLA